jgi:hypothetical protein
MIIIEKFMDFLDKLWSGIKFIFLFKWLIRKKSDWNKVFSDLEIGDIGLIDGTGLLSDGIEWFESVGKDKSHVAHCFIVTTKEGEIVEALSDKIKKQDIRKYFDEQNRLIIRRFKKPLNATDKAKVVEKAYSMIDQPYDYKQFIGLAVSYLLIKIFRKFGKWLVERFKIYRGAENKVQCSTLVAASYSAINLSPNPGWDLDEITPKSIYQSKELVTIIDIKGTQND